MELEEIARNLEEIRLDMLREVNAFERRDAGPHRVRDACVRIYAVGRMLDDLADATAPGATVEGEGFVVLPIGRFDELRQAEEHLEETRFAPSDGEADEAAMARRVDELRGINEDLHGLLREQAAENGRLKAENDRWRGVSDRPLEPFTPGPMTVSPRVADEVLLKHIQDHQAEIEGIKDRLDEQSDRINALVARMIRLDADIMPIRQIGPGTGPEARQRDEATKARLLQEVYAARKLDPS
jgi:hypothetical protein